jgi:Rrf2 family protein
MQVTRAADYAVRVMIHLAALPPKVKAQRADIARATGVAESFVSKVLQRLVRSGLVLSHRGTGGGYQMAAHKERVSLLEVVEAIEGPTQLNLCLASGSSCDRKLWCAAHGVWDEAQNALVKVLKGASIAALAAKSANNLALLHPARGVVAMVEKGVSKKAGRGLEEVR